MIAQEKLFDASKNDHFDRIIATVHKEVHHAVMEIRIPSKQVLLYDGSTEVLSDLMDMRMAMSIF